MIAGKNFEAIIIFLWIVPNQLNGFNLIIIYIERMYQLSINSKILYLIGINSCFIVTREKSMNRNFLLLDITLFLLIIIEMGVKWKGKNINMILTFCCNHFLIS